MLSQLINESKKSLYLLALFLKEGKATCQNMSITTGISHDKLYRALNIDPYTIKDSLEELAKKTFGNDPVTAIIDETTWSKKHSKETEGVGYLWDSSSGRSVAGLGMSTFMLTNGTINLPVCCSPYLPKSVAGPDALTKTQIAALEIIRLKSLFNIKRVLTDAHYSTKEFVQFLHENNISYCMKIALNKKVKIGQNIGQLRHLLKPIKNTRTACRAGFFNAIPCFFYFVKYDEKVLYYISNDQINRKEIASIYKRRWKIEKFHRTAKQLLGFKDCQSRSHKKQLVHVLYVMQTYAYAEIKRVELGYEKIEDFINVERRKKRPKIFQDLISSSKLSANA